ncbi:MAG: hypothetical protein M3R06_06175 [Chloroflexota bacterium]|nr:hypothetical protein [Chloroflexota bacterium]
MVTADVGVLCARVRMEEKWVIAALATNGITAPPVPPARLPLPLDPSPSASANEPRLLIDRCQDRAVAAAIIPLWRGLGVTVLDAGLAATGNRLAIASALGTAGLPRPAARLVCATTAALRALETLSYPATLLPLRPGDAEIVLPDRDTAEAVLEHREVLGANEDRPVVIQAGAPGVGTRVVVDVVGGQAVGYQIAAGYWAGSSREAEGLAERAATALGAAIVGIVVAQTDLGLVIWDVLPVSEFRHAVKVTGSERDVASAIAALVEAPRMESGATRLARVVDVGAEECVSVPLSA